VALEDRLAAAEPSRMVWVEPSVRCKGIGRRLVDAVAGWARASGAQFLQLALAQHQALTPAASLYGVLGFSETGDKEPFESDPSVTALVMSRPL
jgi:GNAT superfamily N-acetyltransferase